MSENKLVLVKELRTGQSEKTKTTWPEIIDQDNEIWRIFRPTLQIELNKTYLIAFKLNDKGFKDIEQITPVVNIMKTEALKDLANRNDILRLLQFCLSTTKDLVVAGKLEYVNITNISEELYKWINDKADSLMPKENDER